MFIHVLGRSGENGLPQANAQCNFVAGSPRVCALDLIIIITCLFLLAAYILWGIPYTIKVFKSIKAQHSKATHTETSTTMEQRVSTLDPYHVVSSLDDSILVKKSLVPTPPVPSRVLRPTTHDVFYSPGSRLEVGPTFPRVYNFESPEKYRSPPLSLLRLGSHPPSPSPRSNMRGNSTLPVKRQSVPFTVGK
ncbi:hypothetical protein BV22DRAFT_1036414 [Leucogyrophana mollusca]|uniref:Uncharacterized protein n=1 Tax=Leucogyrophana mollusca TaxID=85980 RepID=A0ACB8BCB3_9AGAM|nr:hypothetical protein BV22DRAFT_1036414 [Leucogyrophana mollusca]